MITTNLSQGMPLVLRPQLAFAPLPGWEWSTAKLARALRQANAAVRAQAGMFAWFAPKANSVLFRLGDPGASIRLEDGRTSRVLAANKNGDVEVLLDGAMMKNTHG